MNTVFNSDNLSDVCGSLLFHYVLSGVTIMCVLPCFTANLI